MYNKATCTVICKFDMSNPTYIHVLVQEEEKRQKRQEKQKLERERQLQWKAEMEKEHKRKQRELEEAAERRQQAEKKAPPTNGGKGIKDGSGGPLKKGGDDPKKRLEELLVGAINRVKAPAPVAAVPVTVGESGSSEEETSELSGLGGQTNKYVQCTCIERVCVQCTCTCMYGRSPVHELGET